jgi:predicted ATPase/DNA-binding CsgD family transcriptional regulator
MGETLCVTPVGEDGISPREAEVLAGLGEHLTNAEIGQRLHISVRTVESHVSSLMRKLGATDRRELATHAVKLATMGQEAAVPVLGLPNTWTTFVGRGVELAELSQALATERLVTIVGPGGMGKTRLAIAAAGQAAALFPGGGAFVDLVPVSREFIVEAVAGSLGLGERAGESLTETVLARMRSRRSLLVLDNCEHVLGAVVAFTRSMLASCPEAVVLATTRERFGLAGAREVSLASLSITGDLDNGTAEAQSLFIDRARGAIDADSDPALIDDVCRRLEGVPLAIELAAARLGSLGIDGLTAGLEDHLRLLTHSGATGDDRHGSLRSVIAWSHELLDEEERSMFRRLGVFAGTFGLGAAAMVAGDGNGAATSDLLGRLTDKSLLVHRRHGAESRWRMLDSVRSFARSELEGDTDVVLVRGQYLLWAATAAQGLKGSLDAGLPDWATDFDLVVDDLRAAIAAAAAATAPEPGETKTTGFELALALGHLCYARRFLAEGRAHLNAAIALAPDESRAVIALRTAARAAFSELRGQAAFEFLVDASARAATVGDARIVAITLAEAAAIAGRCPALFVTPLTHDEVVAMEAQARFAAPDDDLEVEVHLALAETWDSILGLGTVDLTRAERALSLARRYGESGLISSALDGVTAALLDKGFFKEASRVTQERMALLDKLPRHDLQVGGEIADTFHMATQSAVGAGDLQTALASAERAHEDSTREGLSHFAAADLVMPLAMLGLFDEALRQAIVMRDGWQHAEQTAGWMGPSFFAVALVYGLRGDDDAYQEWWDLATQIAGTSSRSKGQLFGFFVAPRVALHRGLSHLARTTVISDDQASTGLFSPYAQAMRAEVAVAVGAPDAASRLAAAQPLAQQNDFAAALLQRAAGRLHHDHGELEKAVPMWEAIGARFEHAYTLTFLPDRAEEGERELRALGCSPPSA